MPILLSINLPFISFCTIFNHMTNNNLLKSIKIGNMDILKPVLLAPMAGVTDKPMRQIVRSYGVGLCYSEMIASQAMVRANDKTLRMSSQVDDDKPLAIQIAGSNPQVMVAAAKMNADRGACLIDVNCGCPVKKIVKGLAGSALMQNIELAVRNVEAIVKAVDIPVTVKMRLGWDKENMNAAQLAYWAQEAGASMVTVHGRTRQQFYNGTADWQAIANIVKAVDIPVIANGDIFTPQNAKEALKQSGARGVMIARGIYGKPWLPSHIVHFLETGEELSEPNLKEKCQLILKHFENIISFYGEYTGVRMARKHMGWYSKGLRESAEFRRNINKLKTADEVRRQLHSYFQAQLTFEERCKW